MKVALIGGTGFVGSYITDELISHNMVPRLLIREGSESKILQPEKCEIVYGDLSHHHDRTSVPAILEVLEGCDAVIYNVGVIREFPSKGLTYENLHFHAAKWCIDAAKELNVSRFILMSANGVKKEGTGYQNTKMLAEEYLKESGLDYTIFRPSLIFGDPRGGGRPEFCSQLKKDMLSLPIPAPNFHKGLNPFNAGNFALSPIHVKDVAKVFVKSLTEEETIKKTYHLGGETYYWKDIISIISRAYGKKKWTIPAPVFAIKTLGALLGGFPWFPVTKDQITMLIEGNVCQSDDVYEMFNLIPTPFNSESLSYLKS